MNDKVKGLFDRLEQGVKDVFESDKYREYLSHMAKFHSYSARNSLLILLQRPNASYVAGYNSWIKDHKRHVMPGEKGIQILGFTPYKHSYLQDKKDSQGKPILDHNGKIVKEEITKKIAAFKPVYVYDISQTDGEPIPHLAKELIGSVNSYEDMMASLKKISPYPISFEEMNGEKKGYCSYLDNKIAIKTGMSEQATIKTAIHEITHAIAHAPKQDENGKDIILDRQTEEVQAESTAFVVCEHFGIDTSDYSFPYLAAWSGSKELSVLQSSLDTIQKHSSKLINEIDSNLSLLQKSRNYAVSTKQDTAQLFADDFSRTMQDYYKDHPLFVETFMLANTSPSFIANQIEIGDTLSFIEPALRDLESNSNYNQAADSFRTRLNVINNTLHKQDTKQQQIVNSLSSNWRQSLSNDIHTVLQFFIDNDIKSYGKVRNDTLDILKGQGYTSYDGQLELITQQHPIQLDQTDRQKITYTIYQLKQNDITRNLRSKPYIAGLTVNPRNYDAVYSGQMDTSDTPDILDTLYRRFHIHPDTAFTGFSLSVSDVIVLNRDNKETAYYVDRFGYKEIPEFLNSDLSTYIKADKAVLSNKISEYNLHENKRHMDEIHDSVKFDNDIDLDKEKSRSQLGFKDDNSRSKVSMNDRIAAAQEKSQQRNIQDNVENEKEKSECLQ